VPDESWPEPSVRPAVDQLIDSREEPLLGTGSTSIFADPPSPPSAACIGPAAGVSPLADSIAADLPDAEADRRRGRRRESRSPARASSPRPFLGVDVTEDGNEPLAAPSGTRIRMLVGVAAAAIVIVALGGYALVRPSSVGAIATRRASPPQPAAAPDAASATPASAAASPAPVGTKAAPSTPEAPPPVAEPVRPASTGTVEVVSPVSLNVSEGGRPLGTSGAPIQLSVGRHSLEIGRDDLGYHAAQVVDVQPGRPHRIQPSLPTGVANLNATPWAEVWIDGRKVGETPLGRVQLTIGSHEVQFRHPELGDQTRTLVVTTGSVALVSVDLKK
jgi:serine/threonine-protein kinase